MTIFVWSVVIGIGLALLMNYLRMRRRRDTFVRPVPPTVVKWTVCGVTAIVLKKDLIAAEAEYERKVASGEIKASGADIMHVVLGRTLTFAPANHWIWRNPPMSRFITWRSEELETMLDGFIVEQAPFFVPFSSDGLACWDWQMENFQPIPIDEARRLLESGKRH